MNIKRILSIILLVIIMSNFFALPVSAFMGFGEQKSVTVVPLIDLKNRTVKDSVVSSTDDKSKNHLDAQLGIPQDFRINENNNFETYNPSDSSRKGIEIESLKDLMPEYFYKPSLHMEKGEVNKSEFKYSDKRSFGKELEDRKVIDGLMSPKNDGKYKPRGFPSEFKTKPKNSTTEAEEKRAQMISQDMTESIDTLLKTITSYKGFQTDEDFFSVLAQFVELSSSKTTITYKNKTFSTYIGKAKGGTIWNSDQEEANKKSKSNYIYDRKGNNIYMYIWEGTSPINSVSYGDVTRILYAVPKGYQYINGEKPELNVAFKYPEDSYYFNVKGEIATALFLYTTGGHLADTPSSLKTEKSWGDSINDFVVGIENSIIGFFSKDITKVLTFDFQTFGTLGLMNMMRPFMFLIFIVFALPMFIFNLLRTSFGFFKDNSGVLAKVYENFEKLIWVTFASSTMIEFFFLAQKLSIFLGEVIISMFPSSMILTVTTWYEGLLAIPLAFLMWIIYFLCMASYSVAIILTILGPAFIIKDTFGEHKISFKHHIRIFGHLAMTAMIYFIVTVALLFAKSYKISFLESVFVAFLTIKYLLPYLDELTGINISGALGGVVKAGAFVAGMGATSVGLAKRGAGALAGSGKSTSSSKGGSTSESGSATEKGAEGAVGEGNADNQLLTAQLNENREKLSAPLFSKEGIKQVGGILKNDFKEVGKEWGNNMKKAPGNVFRQAKEDLAQNLNARTGGSQNKVKQALAGAGMAKDAGVSLFRKGAGAVATGSAAVEGASKIAQGALSGNTHMIDHGAHQIADSVGSTASSVGSALGSAGNYIAEAHREQEAHKELMATQGEYAESVSTHDNNFLTPSINMDYWKEKGLTSIDRADKGQLTMNYDYFGTSGEMRERLDRILDVAGSNDQSALQGMGINSVDYHKIRTVDGETKNVLKSITLSPQKASQYMGANSIYIDKAGGYKVAHQRNSPYFLAPDVNKYYNDLRKSQESGSDNNESPKDKQ